jgi:hypothetical protein
MKSIEYYLWFYGDLTANQAVQILKQFDRDHEQVIVYDVNRSCNTTMSVRVFLCGINGSDKARNVGPLQFCGGPPGQYIWANGSLLTMAVDAIMHHQATEDRKIQDYGTKVAL